MLPAAMLARRRQIVSAAPAMLALALFAALGGARANASPPAGASSAPPRPRRRRRLRAATLDGSALLDGAVTVSPMPGATDATPHTQISFLGVAARRSATSP